MELMKPYQESIKVLDSFGNKKAADEKSADFNNLDTIQQYRYTLNKCCVELL